jgi:hypothetical protein
MTLSFPPAPAETAFAGDLDDRRRHARGSAFDRIASGSVDPDSWSPQVAVVPFAPGAAVVALAGAFDRAGVEVLRGVSDDLDRLAATELVIDMTRVTECDQTAARVVARWRIRRLAAGASVELHGAPPAVRAELGQHPTPF